MSIAFRFDDSNTERSKANELLAQLNLTQVAIDAANKMARGDASAGTVGIGSAGAPSQNPLGIGPTPGPTFVQPNPPPSPTVAVPPANVNAMQIPATSPTPYVQPDYRIPKANPGGVVSGKNPMGL